MSSDLDRLLTDAAATPTRPVDVDALHARAQRARHRNQLVVGLSAVALLIAGTAAVLAASVHNQRVELAPADAPNGQDVARPPETATDPLHLVLSHQQVASTGQTITLAVVNGSDRNFFYGADGVLQRWDGTEWAQLAHITLARTWWESGGSVALPGDTGSYDVPSIGYDAAPGGAGEPEWLTLPALEPGWYQLVRRAAGGMEGDTPDTARGVDGPQQATAVLQVVAADEPLQPALALPWEDPYLGFDIAALGTGGGSLDMVPAEGIDVAGRSDTDNRVTRHGRPAAVLGSAQLSRWNEDGWSSSQTATMQLRPEEPVSNVFAVRVGIPPLGSGFWRVQVEAADGGQLTGYLWVLDALPSEGHPDAVPPPPDPEGEGTDPFAMLQMPWTVLAADVATTDGIRVAARDVDELAQTWAAASAFTDPPTAPPDSAVVVVSVPSSTCRARGDVLGVEVSDVTIVVILDEEGEFTRPCPGPPDAPRGTVFAIAVPLDAIPEHSGVLTRTATR